jgi:IS1 family transposase
MAYAIGDLSKDTGKKLWAAIPDFYRTGHCFTDFWSAYQAVLPEKHHTAVGKETGETAHVERWNTTLRQRPGRFVRETLSFSRINLHAYYLLRPFSPSLQFSKGPHSQVSHYRNLKHTTSIVPLSRDRHYCCSHAAPRSQGDLAL